MELMLEEKKKNILFRGPNSAKIFNLVHLLICKCPKSKIKF